jgi:hypothetical protein
MDSAMGKPCPKCMEPMSNLSSQFIRMCTSCKHVEAWELEKGQPPLLTDSRDRGMA